MNDSDSPPVFLNHLRAALFRSLSSNMPAILTDATEELRSRKVSVLPKPVTREFIARKLEASKITKGDPFFNVHSHRVHSNSLKMQNKYPEYHFERFGGLDLCGTPQTVQQYCSSWVLDDETVDLSCAAEVIPVGPVTENQFKIFCSKQKNTLPPMVAAEIKDNLQTYRGLFPHVRRTKKRRKRPRAAPQHPCDVELE